MADHNFTRMIDGVPVISCSGGAVLPWPRRRADWPTASDQCLVCRQQIRAGDKIRVARLVFLQAGLRRVLANSIHLACYQLIAAPRTDREELRSETWATVRYARAAGKSVVMLSRGEKD